MTKISFATRTRSNILTPKDSYHSRHLYRKTTQKHKALLKTLTHSERKVMLLAIMLEDELGEYTDQITLVTLLGLHLQGRLHKFYQAGGHNDADKHILSVALEIAERKLQQPLTEKLHDI